jgi:small nuclear ribonucleoprotein (snRNP)-like protein
MSSVSFNQLNILFQNQERIDTVLDYLMFGNYPKYITDTENKKTAENGKKRYRHKFRLFTLDSNNNIIYKPTNLRVVNEADVKDTLTEVFESNNGLGKGVTNFYKFIKTKYIGIKRQDCEDFLKLQGEYQMITPHRHRINKPIISKNVNDLWAGDLIDMNLYKTNNRGYRYIFTLVDIFSRNVFLLRLKNKDAQTLQTAFSEFLAKLNDKPKSLLLDNGTEFLGEFAEYCKRENIKIRHTTSYSPQSNGVCERMNREVRKILKAMFVRNNDLVWYDKLDEVSKIKNLTYHSSIKIEPQTVYDFQANTPEDFKKKIAREAREAIRQKAMRDVAKYKANEYKVGDWVRITMSAVYPSIRQIIKSGNAKQIVVQYLPILFQIKSVIYKRKGLLEKNEYTLIHDGHTLCTPLKIRDTATPKRLFASDLIAVDEDTKIEMTAAEALKLNKATTRVTDLRLVEL